MFRVDLNQNRLSRLSQKRFSDLNLRELEAASPLESIFLVVRVNLLTMTSVDRGDKTQSETIAAFF